MVRYLAGFRNVHLLWRSHTGSGAHSTLLFNDCRGRSGWGVKLTTYIHLVPRLKIVRTVTPLHLWRAQRKLYVLQTDSGYAQALGLPWTPAKPLKQYNTPCSLHGCIRTATSFTPLKVFMYTKKKNKYSDDIYKDIYVVYFYLRCHQLNTVTKY
jgi:hypothetical protein